MISRPKNTMMRSFASPMNIAPVAETMASTWNSHPSTPSRRRYPSPTSAERIMAHATVMVMRTLKPSTTTAWSMAV